MTKRFYVLKASLDGMSGGAGTLYTLDEVLREVHFSCGWDSPEQLHAAIRGWADAAYPGQVFTTQVSAVVCCDGGEFPVDCLKCGRPNDRLVYEDINGTENGELTQEVSCPACNTRWRDVFHHADRQTLAPRRVKRTPRYTPCDVLSPSGERCELRGKGHPASHTWEECAALGPNDEVCYNIEPVGPAGFPRPSRRGHAGPHSWET